MRQSKVSTYKLPEGISRILLLCKFSTMKVLMVCLGNICRSPLAEGILRHKCEQQGLLWEIDSAGTNGLHNGEKPYPDSQVVAKLNGIDISKQRSRSLKAEDFNQYDLIVSMANDVSRQIQRISGSKFNPDKLKLLLNYTFPDSQLDVPDPWGRSISAFHEVYQLIDQACDALIQEHTSIKQP